jgi:hypothetical protein
MMLFIAIGRVPTAWTRLPGVRAIVADELGRWQLGGRRDAFAWVGSILAWTIHGVPSEFKDEDPNDTINIGWRQPGILAIVSEYMVVGLHTIFVPILSLTYYTHNFLRLSPFIYADNTPKNGTIMRVTRPIYLICRSGGGTRIITVPLGNCAGRLRSNLIVNQSLGCDDILGFG